jgi:hypothetical protein
MYSVQCTHAKCLQLRGGYSCILYSSTAVPHECTMHGDNRYPDLDLG